MLENQWRLVPDMGGILLMRGLVRDDMARELAFTRRKVDAYEAAVIGLVTRVCVDPLAAVHALADAITRHSPGAIRAGKRLFNLAHPTGDESAAAILKTASAEQGALLGWADQIEPLRANVGKCMPMVTDTGA